MVIVEYGDEWTQVQPWLLLDEDETRGLGGANEVEEVEMIHIVESRDGLWG